jgi:hypothetical protein
MVRAMMRRDKKDEPPLADISIGGRTFKTEQKAFERFGADLARELKIEIDKLSEESERNGLYQAGKRLRDAIAQLMQMAAAMPDRMQGAKLLRASLYLMFTSADTASRIDRKLIPRMIEPLIEKKVAPLIEKKVKKALGASGGTASGKKRRDEAEEGWKPHALKLAQQARQEQPGITQANLVDEIKIRWRLKISCPGTQLIPAISGWEKDGTLIRRDK